MSAKFLAALRLAPGSGCFSFLLPPSSFRLPGADCSSSTPNGGTEMRANPLSGALAFTGAVVGALAGNAQQSADPRVAARGQSGKLRVPGGLGSPVLPMKDA